MSGVNPTSEIIPTEKPVRLKDIREYFTNEKYLNLVEKKFGVEERQNVIDMSKIKLKRKLLGD